MKVILALLLLCSSLVAYAEAETNTEKSPADNLESDIDTFNLMLAVGLTIGGDDLAVATNDTTVTSGGLIYLAIGGVYHVNPIFDVQASFGYHFDTVTAQNGTADFSRTFLELMPFYVTQSGNRFGIGFTNIMSPEFNSPLGGGLSFDDTSGVIIEYDWQLAPKYFIGLRYADITYKSSNGLIVMPDSSITDEVDGSYIGVIMQGNF